MAVKEAGFYPIIVVTDKCHIYDFLKGYRKLKHVYAHFETKFVPYGEGSCSCEPEQDRKISF